MNIRDFSSDFLVYILSQDVELSSHVKLAHSEAKYDTYYFSDHSELMLRMASLPCHVLIVDVETLITPAHELIEKILKISAEVQIIVLAPQAVAASFKKYRKYNVVFTMDKNSKSCAEMTLMTTDLICENLYRLYQNEQLFEAYQKEKDQKTQILEKNQIDLDSATVRPFQNRISQYRLAESKEQLFDYFFQATPTQSWMYLKLVPTIQTLICVSSANTPEDWSEGLSYKIPQKDKNFSDVLLTGILPEGLHLYLKEKFSVPRIKFLPLIIKKNIEGLLISTQDISEAVAEDFSLMSLVYTNLVYESQPKYLDIEDNLTGFYNELFYKRILDKEVDRSRRTFSPLSLIKIKIDKFIEIEASYGKGVADEIIKKVADQIKATSRLPDYICRTAENEFSLVLTNCHRKGAALRAERLRQALAAVKYTKSGLQITVSQGISEYPSLTSSIDGLDQSATSAVKFISEKGGNKICIYKAQVNHQPDFMVSV